MKRTISLTFGILFLLIGCGGQSTPANVADEAVVAAGPTATALPATEPVPTEEPSATPVVEPTPVPPPATSTPLPTSTPAITEEPTATITAEADVAATPEPSPSAVSESETPATETPTAEPEESGEEVTGTATAASPTAAAPPSGGGVSQPPYEASACSDKYPCSDDAAAWEARIQVPAGYSAEYFAYIPSQNLTGLAFGPDGFLYVASQQGTIYRVDSAGQTSSYVGGLIAPTGMEFRPGTSQLYVSTRVREENYGGEAQVVVIENGGVRQLIGGLPCCYAFMHGPHGIAFDTAGNGYVGVGATTDRGELITDGNVQDGLLPNEAVILRFNPDTGAYEKYADGLRNPYGVAIDANNTLFATDNGPDYGPPDEFHRIVPGANHGFPYYDCEDCFSPPEGVTPLPATYNFPAHSSPTGLTVYTGSQFPNAYNNIFVTLWSAFPGAQKIVRFGPGGVGASNFATGFAAPIDIATDPAGNMYVADWATGIIYKISYTG